jgi:hypothetical protein
MDFRKPAPWTDVGEVRLEDRLGGSRFSPFHKEDTHRGEGADAATPCVAEGAKDGIVYFLAGHFGFPPI